MARKTKKWVMTHIQSYIEALRLRFPFVEVKDIIPGKIDGADAWIIVEAPEDKYEEVMDTVVDLQFQWHDEQGVDLLVSVKPVA